MYHWVIAVLESREDDHHYYKYKSWDEVIARLGMFDGYAVEYSVYRERDDALED